MGDADLQHDEVWELWSPDQLLGVLSVESTDQPWFMCRFEPTPAFAALRPRFDEELRLLEDLEEGARYEEWERVWEGIASLGMVLRRRNDGTEVSAFLLHIDGQEAWFRY